MGLSFAHFLILAAGVVIAVTALVSLVRMVIQEFRSEE